MIDVHYLLNTTVIINRTRVFNTRMQLLIFFYLEYFSVDFVLYANDVRKVGSKCLFSEIGFVKDKQKSFK